MLRSSGSFIHDERGAVAILFGISALTLVSVVGGGADLGRLQLARQSTGNALSLTCQFFSKSSPAADAKATTTEVRAFFDNGSGAETRRNANVTLEIGEVGKDGSVELRASGALPTVFMKVMGFDKLPLNVTRTCAAPAAAPPPPSRTPGTVVLRETFESGPAATNTGWAYVGAYNGWSATGEGLELSAGYKQGAPEGRSVGELVADRSVAMYRKISLRAGTYELRYWYAGSPWVPTPAYRTPYDPLPVCARDPADVAWATADPTQPSRAAVYLSPDAPGWSVNWMGMTPTNPRWRPGDLLETCIHSFGWVERSLTISIPRDGDYWIVFAGQSTHSAPEGAQIDDIRLCVERCEGTRRLAPFETRGTVLFSDNFRKWPVGCCSISATAQGWGSYPQFGHEVWDGTLGGASRFGPFNVVEIDNAGNVALGRSFLLAQGSYELTYTYAARIKFRGIPDVATCGPIQKALAIQAFPSGSAVAESGDWQSVARHYDTNAMAVFIDNESLATGPLPATMVDYCVYGGSLANPVRRVVRFQVTRPGFHRITFRGEGASDSVGALLSNVTLCAESCATGRSLAALDAPAVLR
jgi:hypothetical protein